MIAMNVQTYEEDMATVRSGGWLIYDSTWPRSSLLDREDINVFGVPLSRMCNEHFDTARARILMKNIAYVGVVAALLDIDLEVIKTLLGETFATKTHLIDSQTSRRFVLGYDYASRNFQCPLPVKVEKMDKTAGHIIVDGNTAAGLGCVYAGATVGAWYPITPSTSLMDAYKAFCRAIVKTKTATRATASCRPKTSSRRSAWCSARPGTVRVRSRPTSGPGISLMNEFIGFAYYAEVPAVIFNVQRTGPSTGMPTRTQQCDLISCAYASHGDTKHVLLFPANPEECFYSAPQAFDLADRLQTPVMVFLTLMSA